jgi:tetratricopeptide (TPR) repeat protein
LELTSLTSLPSLEEAFNHALGLHRAGEEASAESLYQKILAQQPNHAHAVHGLGAIAFNRQRYPEALALFRLAATLQPEEGVFLCSLGAALQACGWVNEALDTLRKAVRVSPEFVGSWRNLLKALEALGLGQSEEARRTLDRITELTASLANEYNECGLRLAREQRLEEACDAFVCAIRTSPEKATLYHNLGNAMLLRGRLEESVSCLIQALRLEPYSAETYRSLGNALRVKGDIAGAIHAYEQALVAQPSMEDVSRDLAMLRRVRADD